MGKQPEYLYVKNWSELQHYTKRNPPWIKLYRRLLKEGDFMHLGEIEQWQLVRIWLVSAEEHPGGWVPNDQSWLRRMTGSLRALPVERFIDQGWLEAHSASAYASALASTVAINDVAKDPPKLPPRDTEIHKEPFLPSSSTEDGKEGRNGNEEHPPFELGSILKEVDAA